MAYYTKKINSVIFSILFLAFPIFLVAQDCPINAVDNFAGTPGAGSQYSFTVADCADYAPGTVTFTSDGGGAYIVNGCNANIATFVTTNGTFDPLTDGGIVATFSNGAGNCEYGVAGNLIVAEVPTLSQWGLIILALLLMIVGALYLLQPQFQPENK